MTDATFLNPADDDQRLLAQVIDYYQRSLRESTEALDYLQARGITASEAIDAFRIGYANRALGLTLPIKQIKAGKQIRTRLQQLGVLRSSGHEHFNGSVVFPITAADGSGRVVDIYGRKTGRALRPGTPLLMHLNEDRRGVWNINALRAGQEIILCPSLFDALTFWVKGYRNVTCMFGPDALTEDLMTAFAEFGIRRIIVCNEALAPKLLAAGIDVFLMRFPQSQDANKYALSFADSSRALGAIIRRAEWLGKGQPPRSTVAVPEVVAVEPDDLDEELDAPDDDETDDEVANLEEPDDEQVPVAAPAPVLAASPLPPAPEDIESDQHGDEVVVNLGHRRYRIRGLSKNLAFDQLKVNVLASTEQGMYVDTLDLYAARHRRHFVSQTAIELGIDENTVKKDLGRVLLKLEELQDEQITRMMEPKEPLPTMTRAIACSRAFWLNVCFGREGVKSALGWLAESRQFTEGPWQSLQSWLKVFPSSSRWTILAQRTACTRCYR